MCDWRPHLDRIDEVVATDTWKIAKPTGEEVLTKVTVGKPAPNPTDPNGDWYCPVEIEGRTNGIRCVFGVGPVDALMNAMQFVKQFFDEVEPEPRAR